MNESKEKATNDPESRLSMKSFRMQLALHSASFFFFLLLSLQYLILVELKVHHKINDWLSVTWSSLDLDDDENLSSERFFLFSMTLGVSKQPAVGWFVFVFSSATRQKKEKKQHLRQLLYDKQHKQQKKMKTLCGQSKQHNMQCSFNLHWLLAAWGEGTGSELRGTGSGRGVGLTGELVGWVERVGGKKEEGVLQVTVQVKRQILSAVWRKALEVPTVQRERSSYVWNTSSAWFQRECVGRESGGGGGRSTGKERKKETNTLNKWKQKRLSSFHFLSHAASCQRFHIFLERRQFYGTGLGT